MFAMILPTRINREAHQWTLRGNASIFPPLINDEAVTPVMLNNFQPHHSCMNRVVVGSSMFLYAAVEVLQAILPSLVAAMLHSITALLAMTLALAP